MKKIIGAIVWVFLISAIMFGYCEYHDSGLAERKKFNPDPRVWEYVEKKNWQENMQDCQNAGLFRPVWRVCGGRYVVCFHCADDKGILVPVTPSSCTFPDPLPQANRPYFLDRCVTDDEIEKYLAEQDGLGNGSSCW